MGSSEQYRFDAELWEWDPKGGWFFVSLPEAVTDEIDERFGHRSAGFGSLRVEVTIGATTWRTSVFPDTKQGTFVLPIKRPVRRAEGLDGGSTCTVTLTVVTDRP